MAEKKKAKKSAKKVAAPPVAAPGPIGCCTVKGRPPFPATQAACTAAGGKWDPAPCDAPGPAK